DSVDSDLLSLCFCRACADRYPAGTRDHVKAAIDRSPALGPGPSDPGRSGLKITETHNRQTPPETLPGARVQPQPTDNTSGTRAHQTSTANTPAFTSVDEALGTLADEVRAVRVDLSASLRRTLIAAARDTAPEVPITIHANPDPWATAAFAALPEGEPGADVLVANCWGDPATDTARLARLVELCRPGQRVGAYVLGLPPRPADPQAQAELLRAYAKAGASEFHLYHAGLASPHRLSAIQQALRLIG
ncbi:hypothetical protein AB0I64_40275, partial [Nonomuraea sp. NPDC050405]